MLRGIIGEYGSKLCSYKHHTVLITMNCMKKMIDNKVHMFCLLGTLQNLRVQCERVILVQLPSLHCSCTQA